MDGDGSNGTTVLPYSNEEYFKKLSNLSECIKSDIYAADLKWSLLVAASHSYRFETCLHPFPPQYIKDDQKDVEKLREVMTHMPSLPTLLTLLDERSTDFSNRKSLLELLHWVLIEQNDPFLETVRKEEFSSVLSKVSGQCKISPHFVFRVHHRVNPDSQIKFHEAVKKHGSIFAYHGSRLENIFSILNYGLLTTLNKQCDYGKGIYLSSELMVSMMYSQMAFGWGGSIIGSQLSCLALCEVVNHPDLKCQMPDAESSPTKSTADDSSYGQIPEKHFLAQNSELVQVRYLLVYAANPHSVSQNNSNRSMLGWLNKHKLLTLMVGYVVLLGAVGMSNNPTVMRYYRMFLRRWGP